MSTPWLITGGGAIRDNRGVDVDTCIAAYRDGAFPMDEPGARHPGFYVCDPRAVIPVDGFRVPRTVARRLRHAGFEMRLDAAFADVVAGCAGAREGGVWLTPRLARLYDALHARGVAHSVEAWRDGRLCGGLFGVALGGLFTSESMFHAAPDAGNAALVFAHAHVARRGYALWDIQMATDHTRRFGAVEVSAGAYRVMLAAALRADVTFTDAR